MRIDLLGLSWVSTLMLGACTSLADHGSDTSSEVPKQAATTHAPARVLVFTRTAGYRHKSIASGVQAVREMAQDAGLRVQHTEDPAVFTDAGLRGLRAVVFLSTSGDVLDQAQQDAFERYVANGGSYLGIHGAAATEYDWPWYGALLGAWFDNHPSGLRTTDVRFEAAHAPLARIWRINDELYNYRRNPRGDVEVLATIDERVYEGGKMGSDHPIAWCHAPHGGRAWYTGLGHDHAMYADPVFRAHLTRGLRYASRLSDAC